MKPSGRALVSGQTCRVRVADNLGNHPRHDPNQEPMAQGVAKRVTPFFGGVPATGTLARTVTPVRAGAASPVAGMVHALTLLLILLAAALAGILHFVARNLFEGHQFTRLRQFSAQYRTLMVGTFVLTIVFDLTVSVAVGLVLANVNDQPLSLMRRSGFEAVLGAEHIVPNLEAAWPLSLPR